MSDLISRQAALEAVSSEPLYRTGLERKYADEAVPAIFEKIKALQPAEPKQKWIPCSERLPEEDGVYLVTTSKGQVQSHVFNHNGNSQEYWLRCNRAWMPLPEPYKAERKEE